MKHCLDDEELMLLVSMIHLCNYCEDAECEHCPFNKNQHKNLDEVVCAFREPWRIDAEYLRAMVGDYL